jgi:hypothetical protein
MGPWQRLRARLFGFGVEPADTAPIPDDDVSVRPAAPEMDAATLASRQERAASRILEDERLRGDLEDDAFQPLLDWALAEADRVAVSTDGLSDDQADARIDASLQAIREVVEAAGAAIVAYAEGDANRRSSELAFVGTRRPDGGRIRSLAARLDAEPDLSGPEVATLIVGALAPPPAGPPGPGIRAASESAS